MNGPSHHLQAPTDREESGSTSIASSFLCSNLNEHYQSPKSVLGTFDSRSFYSMEDFSLVPPVHITARLEMKPRRLNLSEKPKTNPGDASEESKRYFLGNDDSVLNCMLYSMQTPVDVNTSNSETNTVPIISDRQTIEISFAEIPDKLFMPEL